MLVVDASFLLAILLNELNEGEKKEAIERLDTQILIAPQLLRLEIGNSLITQMRRNRIDFDFAKQALRAFSRLIDAKIYSNFLFIKRFLIP